MRRAHYWYSQVWSICKLPSWLRSHSEVNNKTLVILVSVFSMPRFLKSIESSGSILSRISINRWFGHRSRIRSTDTLNIFCKVYYHWSQSPTIAPITFLRPIFIALYSILAISSIHAYKKYYKYRRNAASSTIASAEQSASLPYRLCEVWNENQIDTFSPTRKNSDVQARLLQERKGELPRQAERPLQEG